jgi:translation elongation factor EF-Tu-like GTPase
MKPSLLARIKVKSEKDGGRSKSLTKGLRPHLLVAGHDVWMGISIDSISAPIGAGLEYEIVASLIYHPKVDYGVLKEETKFEIMEGPRSIATGVVLEVRNAR